MQAREQGPSLTRGCGGRSGQAGAGGSVGASCSWADLPQLLLWQTKQCLQRDSWHLLWKRRAEPPVPCWGLLLAWRLIQLGAPLGLHLSLGVVTLWGEAQTSLDSDRQPWTGTAQPSSPAPAPPVPYWHSTTFLPLGAAGRGAPGGLRAAGCGAAAGQVRSWGWLLDVL